MIFSRACEYGLRTLLFLAGQPNGQPYPVRDIAQTLQVPPPFLAKIVQDLARRGLLNSQKGRGGGICLAKPPETITPLEIVEAIDGPDVRTACLLGLPECGDEAPCPLHQQWATIRAEILDALGNQNLAELSEKLEPNT